MTAHTLGHETALFFAPPVGTPYQPSYTADTLPEGGRISSTTGDSEEVARIEALGSDWRLIHIYTWAYETRPFALIRATDTITTE